MDDDRDASNGGRTKRVEAHAGPMPEGWSRSVCIPDHELLHCIGHGSYGEVWLARNRMGVYRAVKIVHRKTFDHERPFERELSGIRKFEPISRSHQGLIDVLHIGINEEQGYFYYVMELGDDQASGRHTDPKHYSPRTLARVISLRRKLSFDECLQLGLDLSLALAELHSHGLVHRDVKPSNIIFAEGVPKLTDIGLVADLAEARSYVGTEGFIPPEGPGSPQADVYGLGKVLYEASTGKDRHEFPDLPTRLDQLPDRELFLELNEVILQACRNDVNKRYQSALDMHADLLVLANGKSIKRLRLLERRLAGLKRMAGILALTAITLAAVLYPACGEWRNVVESRHRQAGANVAYGNRAVESGELLGALRCFTEALRLDHSDRNRERQHRLRIGSTLSQCAKLEQLWFSGREIADASFSPDGQQVLLSEPSGRIRAFDVPTGKPLGLDIDQDDVCSASYSPDGSLVATASGDRTAGVWRVRDGSRILKLEHPDQVYSARFSPDGLRLVTACGDNTARVWDARTGRLDRVLSGHDGAVSFAAFSHNGRLIVTTSRDRTARLWNAADGRPVGPPLQHANWVTGAAFSPDDRKLVTACVDYIARVWEVPSGRRILPDLNHRDGILSADFSPDGRWIITATLRGTARLWRLDNLQPLGVNPILNCGERVTHAAFDPDGRRIITTRADGTTRIWDLAGSSIAFLEPASGKSFRPPTASAETPIQTLSGRDRRFVLAVSECRTDSNEPNPRMQIWDSATGKAAGPAIPLPTNLVGASLSDDGKHLVTFAGTTAQTWNVLTGAPLSPQLLHDRPVTMAFFSPDNARVLTGSGKRIQVWDATSGLAAFDPLEHPVPVVYAEFNRDGSRLVTCCSDEELTKCFARVWNAATGRPVGAPLRHKDGVLFASFSPDGRRIVTASEDFTAMIWDASSGRPLIPPIRHEHQVRTARFSPDGKWVVTASSDKTARVWNAETGEPLTPPLRHGTTLSGARFRPDGRGIVTSDARGNSWTWELSIDERPEEDLLMLGQLLSDDNVTASGQPMETQPEPLPVLWRRLREKYPSSFTTSAEEIAAWHESQAEECEAQQQWFAAAFHLGRLLNSHPDNPTLSARLDCAKEHLRKGD